MVAILPDEAIDAWLDAPVERSFDFMRQFPTDRLVATPEPSALATKKVKAVRAVSKQTDPAKSDDRARATQSNCCAAWFTVDPGVSKTSSPSVRSGWG